LRLWEPTEDPLRETRGGFCKSCHSHGHAIILAWATLLFKAFPLVIDGCSVGCSASEFQFFSGITFHKKLALFTGSIQTPELVRLRRISFDRHSFFRGHRKLLYRGKTDIAQKAPVRAFCLPETNMRAVRGYCIRCALTVPKSAVVAPAAMACLSATMETIAPIAGATTPLRFAELASQVTTAMMTAARSPRSAPKIAGVIMIYVVKLLMGVSRGQPNALPSAQM